MVRITKRILSMSLAIALVFSGLDCSNLFKTTTEVKAAANPGAYNDTVVVNEEIIPDSELLKALKVIIGNGGEFTFGDLKTYEGDIDLTSYTGIQDITGLGYAMKASSMDLSTLDKVTTIPQGEFELCSFATFKLPCNVETIGKSAFFSCTKLTTIEFPESLTRINAQAFLECSSLNNITLPQGLVKIGNEAFSGCISLESIVIPDKLNATVENSSSDAADGIGTNIFNRCTSLTSITIGKGMTAIPAGFLQQTTSLKSIEIPDAIISIGANAFNESGITSIDLSKNTSMTAISAYCFSGCYYLTDVKLPDSIEVIEEKAFHSSGLACPEMFDNLLNLKKICNSAFGGCKFSKVEIPNNVEIIESWAFKGCSMTSLTFKDFTYEVTNSVCLQIGTEAFSDCVALNSINFPVGNEDNVNFTIEVGTYAFAGCSTLTDIRWSQNITKIDDYAFSECGKSDYIIEKRNVKAYKIDPQYVYDTAAEGLTEVRLFSDDIREYNIIDTAYIDMTKVQSTSVNDSSLAKIYYLDDSSTSTTYYCTQYITGLETIDLENYNNIEFGKNVFAECVNLEKVTLPSKMTEIPEGMFSECGTSVYSTHSTSSINPQTISSLRDFDGKWYTGLETVVMSDNVKKITKNAFAKCYNLKLNGKIPSKVERIGSNAFEYCRSIGAIEFPNTVEYIGNYAFRGCSINAGNEMCSYKGFTECVASNMSNLEYIGTYAFSECSFTKFMLPKNSKIKVIDKNTFDGCQFLETLSLSDEVEIVRANALSGCIRINSILVPDMCTLSQNMLYGTLKIETKQSQKTLEDNCYLYSQDNKYCYFVPWLFSVSVNVPDERKEQVVRVNGQLMLPFLTTYSGENCSFKQLKIGDHAFVYDSVNNEITGDSTDCVMNPLVTSSYVHVIKETDYTDELLVNVIAGGVVGKTTAEAVPVYMETYESFKLITEDAVSLYKECTLSAQYTVDVQDNPCTEIITDKDKFYLNANSATSKTTIAPTFIPTDSSSDITDTVTWTVETGEDLVTLAVASDGKSATVTTKKAGYGSSKILIKAGTVTKEIWVYNSVASSSVSLDKSKCNIMLNGTETLTATLAYSTSDGSEADYPDKITYTSSDENVVKIENVVTADGTTTCQLKAVGAGSATITAKAEASGKTAKCSVSVSTENLQTTITDSSGNEISGTSDINVVSTSGVTLNYGFNETMSDNSLIYEIENPEVASVTYNTSKKTITIKGKSKGSTTITIYPTVGTADQNGITFNVTIDPDVKSIVLTKKTIDYKDTVNVLTSMTNTYNKKITEANKATFDSLTSNDIVFESSNEKIATVDNYGNVTVVSVPDNGEKVKITCTAYRAGKVVKQATATVTAKYPNVTKVNVTGVKNIKVGEKITANIELEPYYGAYQSITVSGSTGYSKKVSVSCDTDAKTITIKGLAEGKVTLTVKVKVGTLEYVKKSFDITVTSKSSTSATSVAQVKKVKAKPGKKKVKLSWRKVKNATGYQIQMSTKKKKGYKTVKILKKNKTTYTKKKLKSKKKYYFRVRAYVKNSSGGKLYGKWSKVKKVKVK